VFTFPFLFVLNNEYKHPSKWGGKKRTKSNSRVRQLVLCSSVIPLSSSMTCGSVSQNQWTMATHVILGYSLLYLTPKEIPAVKFLSMTAINKDHHEGVGIPLFNL
jgi:hypothetical protein